MPLVQGGCVTIGNFDGVHLGHQSMIARLKLRAGEAGVPAVVMTFDPPPVELLRPGQLPPRLTTLEQKLELLEQCGIDCTLVVPTTRDLLNLSPEQFFDEVVRDVLRASGMVEGPNFCFGHRREGTVETLARLCQDHGMSIDIVEPVTRDGVVVSSTVIRGLVTQGRLAEAVELLGHPCRLRGTVVSGAERGRQLGFPTANLDGVETLLPPHGVYAAVVQLDGTQWPAAVNIGPNPTFGEEASRVEVHLIGYTGDLYGRPLDAGLLDRLRSIRKFPDAAALREQLVLDCREAEAAVSKWQEGRG
ncbi:MAG: bifunctional riboflavin kinase/FAD synthetase [Planctomycetaceae bacterium]|nr:bifunctional riboflavin kinase/FAD synthetase [Planctomycetaceae bacterium]